MQWNDGFVLRLKRLEFKNLFFIYFFVSLLKKKKDVTIYFSG